jgi:hypothetical protein
VEKKATGEFQQARAAGWGSLSTAGRVGHESSQMRNVDGRVGVQGETQAAGGVHDGGSQSEIEFGHAIKVLLINVNSG